jgi:hypothetical protein
MWINETRARCDCSRLRYLSDLTEAEWVHVKPLIPPATLVRTSALLLTPKDPLRGYFAQPFGSHE